MEQKILARVRKLLDLANNEAATEGERNNALRMAYGMLAKHNLDISDLDRKTIERIDQLSVGRSMLWCRQINQSVARLFMCKYYIGTKTSNNKSEHHFVGAPANATTAAMVAEYVVTSILAECRPKYGHILSEGTRSFGTGAAATIHGRVTELIKESIPEGSTCTSLVVVSMHATEAEANEAFVRHLGLVSKTVKSVRVRNDAYCAGSDYGGKVGLGAQVRSRQPRLN